MITSHLLIQLNSGYGKCELCQRWNTRCEFVCFFAVEGRRSIKRLNQHWSLISDQSSPNTLKYAATKNNGTWIDVMLFHPACNCAPLNTITINSANNRIRHCSSMRRVLEHKKLQSFNWFSASRYHHFGGEIIEKKWLILLEWRSHTANYPPI